VFSSKVKLPQTNRLCRRKPCTKLHLLGSRPSLSFRFVYNFFGPQIDDFYHAVDHFSHAKWSYSRRYGVVAGT
jgi:hypothetical protein